MLRSADTASARPRSDRRILAGAGPAKVQKTALGAEDFVPWEYAAEIGRWSAACVRTVPIAGLELDDRAVDLAAYRAPERIAVVLGNEVEGVPPSVRALCDDSS